MNMNFNCVAIGATILPNVGSVASGYLMRDSLKKWYPTLKKPKWTPPDWAFGPVWTTLYCSSGYASYLTFRDGGGFTGPACTALAVYSGNLALNWAWSPIFFHWRKLKLAFYELILLDAAAVATGVLFYKINNVAGMLMVPYTMWLGLATALTYKIYRDNPES